MSDDRHRGWLYLGMLSLTHGLSDFYATAFAPLVETFRTSFDLDQAGIAVIGAVIGVFGSMMQPLFGIWGDRARRGLMAAVGLAVSAVFVSCIGLSPNVWVLGALLTVGALGVAAYHPVSVALATRFAPRRSVAVGYFLSGGGLGLALAPLVVPWVVARLGLAYLWVLAFPGAGFAVWIWTTSRDETRAVPSGRAFDLRAMFAPGTGPVWALFAMATLRSLVVTAFIYFASVLGASRGWDAVEAGRPAALFLACGVAGGLWGGYLGQRWDQRLLLMGSAIVAAPLFWWFARTGAWHGWAAFGAAGFAGGIANTLNVSFGQELRPQSAGMVSGLMMGLAWGLSNVLLIPVGLLADHVGIGAALQVVALVSVVGALFGLLLPSSRARDGES